MLKELINRISRDIVVENKQAILELLEPKEEAMLLELGPGDGSFTLDLGRAIGTDQLFIVDIMEDFTRQCADKGIKAFNGDLNESLPFEDSSFDVVVANQVLEHLSRISHIKLG